MRKVFCGTSGAGMPAKTRNLSSINARKELISAMKEFYHSDFCLRPAQEEALIRREILSSTDNAIIATPTNSGKSLISYMLLFEEAMRGNTAVLVEPLRALAYEKTEELKRIAEVIKIQSALKINVSITTGDYRLTDEFLHSQPSGKDGIARGHIIVATPERLDAISRDSDNQEWFRSFRLVCIDEAHLLGDVYRGAALEMLIAFLKTLDSRIRLVLMSATISNPARLASWLAPCQVISDIPRYPALSKWLYCLEDGEEINNILFAEIKGILKDPANSVLVFVYRTASAESFAHLFAERLSGHSIKKRDLNAVISEGTAWFHSKMSASAKACVISAVSEGRVRVVVSTTALAMGINLPATHVFVRDISFSGYGDLEISDLMQMIGRAGRGDRSGTGVVCLSGANINREPSIAQGLETESVPEIRSRLIPAVREGFYGAPREDLFYIDRVGNQLMGILNRYESRSLVELKRYLSNTLSGKPFDSLMLVLQKLCDWKLAFLNEDTNEYALTHLGKISSHCYLPPLAAANIGQLFRDLLEDDPSGKHVSQFVPIDFLIVLCLASDENRLASRFNKALRDRVNGYMESLPLEQKSYLYRTWISSAPDVLFGSARVDGNPAEAEKRVFQSTYTAMLLYDISRGYSSARLQQDYRADVEDIQEKLRDNAIWILCGLERLLDVKSFYFHLKENCHAEYEQIRSVEASFSRASKMIFALVADLKYRSSLGELVRGIKRVYPHADSYPGEGSIQKMENRGIISMQDLTGKTVDDVVQCGIRRDYAEMIIGYIQKRMS